MTFNTPLFLFLFLPVTAAIYLPAGKKLRPWILLGASLAFYTWGAPLYLPLASGLTAATYWLGKKGAENPGQRRWTTSGVALNIGILAFFKIAVRYWPVALGLMETLTGVTLPAQLAGYLEKGFTFPLGLSFMAFTGAAYLLDIRKNPQNAAGSLKECSIFLLLFAKLPAGPIVRFRDTAGQLRKLETSTVGLASGARRFIGGLAKKVLLADQLARLTDGGVFAQATPNLTTGTAWLVMAAYTLQIFYDFSGYTDMAIGLGEMFGLRLPENFDRPYSARSISEFWRRWHITLSGWFRDYVFYPLERRRRGAGGMRQTINILTVFVLTGLWHGVSPNYVLWGGLHGLAIAFENTRIGKGLSRRTGLLPHLYTLGVIVPGWVFFRSPTIPYAFKLVQTMAGFPSGDGLVPYSVLPPLEAPFWMALAAGTALVLPWKAAAKRISDRAAGLVVKQGWIFNLAADAGWIGLLWLCLVVLAGSSYSPYIYGGF